MKSDILWWTFYFYICNVQKAGAVRIFKKLVTPPVAWYTKFEPKVASKTCMLTPSVGPCRDKIPMYYFDPDTKSCNLFDWGGCQGNGNRFATQESCMDTCVTKQGVKNRPRYCSLTFDYGFCFGAVNRWFYDSKWQVCKSTLYSGCGGNKNNFYSKEQCDQICRFGNTPITTRVTGKGGNKMVVIINPISIPTSPTAG